jgi:hypothetical protein
MAGIAPVTDNTVSGACVAAFLFVERPCASATRTPDLQPTIFVS